MKRKHFPDELKRFIEPDGSPVQTDDAGGTGHGDISHSDADPGL